MNTLTALMSHSRSPTASILSHSTGYTQPNQPDPSILSFREHGRVQGVYASSLPRFYLGIDPGGKGGMVLLTSGTTYASASFEKMTMPQVWDWINYAVEAGSKAGGIYAVLEQVGGYLSTEAGNKDGEEGNTGHTMFKFGHAAGSVEAFLVAAGLEKGKTYDLVVPQTWQKAHGMKRGKGEGKTKWKARLRETAKLHFPLGRVTSATGDATLIAMFAKWKKEGRNE